MSRDVAQTMSLYGVAYTQVGRAATEYAGREVTRAWHDGVDYTGHTACRANNDSCTAPRAKGTEYCIGHLRAAAKQQVDEK